MSSPKQLDLAPSPSSLIASLRDIGYSMDTALADVVDNSVAASAENVWIRFSWNDGDPWIAIVDDGHGMPADELINAMRFGSVSPLAERAKHDLGRFGLGLKTASLSQCKLLTVLSQANEQTACCEWDLDWLLTSGTGAWSIKVLDGVSITESELLSSLVLEFLGGKPCGTVVLWRKLDRLDENDKHAQREIAFNDLMCRARQHLELVFHRFISPDPGKPKVRLWMNGDELQAFNPFNPNHTATQELPEQHFQLDGETILVQPYVLPHNNKISPAEYQRFAGEGGYLHNQGFYIYRNRRLIINGTWFRLIKKAELTKLLRVRVDIPNSLDHLWSIDVKKSHASPPARFREQLKQIISRIETQGKRVYEQRGQRLPSAASVPFWERRAAKGSLFYEINRNHPLICQLETQMSREQQEHFRSLLLALETCFPISMLYHDVASKPEQLQPPTISDEQLERYISLYAEHLWKTTRPTSSQIDELLGTEPYASHRSRVLTALKRMDFSGE